MRSALLHGVTVDHIQTVGRKLLAMGQAGDVPATRLLFEYAIGKPANGVDPDDMENGVDLYRQIDPMPSIQEALRATTNTVSGRVLAELVERLISSQDVEHVLNMGLTDRHVQAQMKGAQLRRTAA